MAPAGAAVAEGTAVAALAGLAMRVQIQFAIDAVSGMGSWMQIETIVSFP